ncbi:MAG: COX15/CtaA family protein [Verrucomicrobia subdivision 3 bacterium]|nr:COX15/CtaA family protein [Limisphaerales bacterium]
MTESTNNRWLHRLAVLTATATLFLICVGGLVTSHGVGMSVPDWPTTYGYNMFAFPFSKWIGGVFYEHSHRLVASVVGLVTAILASWIWVRATAGAARWLGLTGIVATLGLMGVRTQTMFVALAVVAFGVIVFCALRLGKDPRPIRWWAMIAFCAVLIQGVLGGLRVTQLKDELGILHATLAQLFFVLVGALAVTTSRRWSESKLSIYDTGGLRYFYLLATGMILLQLIIGASMRHQHAGLAIPDFPLAYGRLWPATDPASIAHYNQLRVESVALNEITASSVILQMIHRITALLICLAIGGALVRTWRRFGWESGFTKGVVAWGSLILVQAGLGAATIWTNKAADIATAHVALGALSLITGSILVLWAFRCMQPAARQAEPLSAPMQNQGAVA